MEEQNPPEQRTGEPSDGKTAAFVVSITTFFLTLLSAVVAGITAVFNGFLNLSKGSDGEQEIMAFNSVIIYWLLGCAALAAYWLYKGNYARILGMFLALLASAAITLLLF